MAKRNDISLERLNKVGFNFSEMFMMDQVGMPLGGQGIIKKGSIGNQQQPPPPPPPGSFGGQGGQGGGFNPSGGYGGGNFTPQQGNFGPQQGNFGPQPFNSNNQFSPENYMPVYQPNNFGVNPNLPMNPNFQGMNVPKTALKYAPDYPEQSKIHEDELDRNLAERLKKL